MKEKIRPIYAELKGYLSQAPEVGNKTYISDSALWERYNRLIDELNNAAEKDYSSFKIKVENDMLSSSRRSFIKTLPYRSALSGLIARLHAEYFTDEYEPFSGTPASIVNFSQSQNQSVHVQILLDMQSKLDEKIGKYETGTKERTFLEKIKESLSGAKGIIELFNMILKIGKDAGLTLDQIIGLFS